MATFLSVSSADGESYLRWCVWSWF